MNRPLRLRPDAEDRAFQEQVQGWINRLAGVLPQDGSGLEWAALSPVKREKHTGRAASEHLYHAARVVLRLLAERVISEKFASLAPEFYALLGGPALTPAEEVVCRAIREEIARTEFDSWSLALLNFAHPDRKRSGSYYTSPELARRITTTALTPEQADRPTLDPACGGGIFLLTALERLRKLQPQISPQDLVIERLYGLDLNPLAVWQARITVLKRLVEIKSPLFPAVIAALAAQVRAGNALVGPVTADSCTKDRQELFQAVRSGNGLAALTEYFEFESDLKEKEAVLAAKIAALPGFNAPGDGAMLAALHPFGWPDAFPEVFKQGGFGTVLGNPPYVGFNDYSGVEKAYFARVFPEVYNLKNDLLYYFIRRGIELLAPAGRLGFVTSRFWKEAAFAAPLRQWLLDHTTLLELEDLGAEQHFSDAEVDVCLLFAARHAASAGHAFAFKFDGKTQKIPQQTLSGKTPWTWLRQLPPERLLLAEIAERSCRLGEIAQCRTGVQTGLDRVFFVDNATARSLDPALLKHAVKNADITPGKIIWRGMWLIYPSLGFDQEEFRATLAYLEKHRPELERRRRYAKSFSFYELQWPREPGVFEASAKLVTPYKAPRNTFAVDRQQFYFSTDVVSVVFPAGWEIEELAANFLNSRLATFQFRSFGKPMGGGQWDYYANPVKQLAFPKVALPGFSGPRPDQILAQLAQPGLSQAELDELVAALYELSPRQLATLNQIK